MTIWLLNSDAVWIYDFALTLQFDFLGKDSIRYFNTVEVEELVYKAIEGFRRGISLLLFSSISFVLNLRYLCPNTSGLVGKPPGYDLFDKLDTTRLNAHLKDLMPGLTAKVFRTYNASITLDDIVSWNNFYQVSYYSKLKACTGALRSMKKMLDFVLCKALYGHCLYSFLLVSLFVIAVLRASQVICKYLVSVIQRLSYLQFLTVIWFFAFC